MADWPTMVPFGRQGRRVRATKRIGPILLFELHDVPWDFWLRDGLIVFCGELGHAEWNLFQIAWKHVVTEIFAEAPRELARRVGIELPSSLTPPTANHRTGE